MRLQVGLLVLVAFMIVGCGTPPTVNQLQEGKIRDIKLYLKKHNLEDPENVQYHFDRENSDWENYWGTLMAEMTPEAEARKWHDKKHTLWIYKIIPLDTEKTNLFLWLFVNRTTWEIEGHSYVK